MGQIDTGPAPVRVAVSGDVDESTRQRVREAVAAVGVAGEVPDHVSVQIRRAPDRDRPVSAHAVLAVNGRIMHARTSAGDADACLERLLAHLADALRRDHVRREHARAVREDLRR